MAQTLDQIIASLNPTYDPQAQLIQGQIDALPGQEQAMLSGLDTAKTKAFQDITNTANDHGVLYSGAPIKEQSQYAGEKFLPAVANIKATTAANKYKLTSALLGVQQSKQQRAQDVLTAEQRAEADAIAQQQKNDTALQVAQIRASSKAAPKEKAPSAADNFQQALSSGFSNYAPANKGGQAFWTEKVLIPQLQSLFPTMNAKQLQTAVYAYRKANFGE